jgi:hypothetical protein
MKKIRFEARFYLEIFVDHDLRGLEIQFHAQDFATLFGQSNCGDFPDARPCTSDNAKLVLNAPDVEPPILNDRSKRVRTRSEPCSKLIALHLDVEDSLEI